MDEDWARTVGRTFGVLFHGVHENLRTQVRDLDRAALNWRPVDGANSIAVLINHTVGSEREMIRAVRKLATERDREAEFKVEADADRLLAQLDQADSEMEEHLAALTAADLTELRARGDRPPRLGIDWLISNYGHSREHLAHVELTKQLYANATG